MWAIFLLLAFGLRRISEIKEEDTVLILGAGPTGICTLLCVRLKNPAKIIVCEKDKERLEFVKEHYPDVTAVSPDELEKTVEAVCPRGGADVVLEVAGAKDTFQMAWKYARPNAVVTVVALYEEDQTLAPFRKCMEKILPLKRRSRRLRLRRNPSADRRWKNRHHPPLITHVYPLEKISQAYELFEKREDKVIKTAIRCME